MAEKGKALAHYDAQSWNLTYFLWSDPAAIIMGGYTQHYLHSWKKRSTALYMPYMEWGTEC